MSETATQKRPRGRPPVPPDEKHAQMNTKFRPDVAKRIRNLAGTLGIPINEILERGFELYEADVTGAAKRIVGK